MKCVGVNQDAIEIQRAEQLLEGRFLAGFVGVIGRLGQGHAKGTGVDGDLRNDRWLPSSVSMAETRWVFPSQTGGPDSRRHLGSG